MGKLSAFFFVDPSTVHQFVVNRCCCDVSNGLSLALLIFYVVPLASLPWCFLSLTRYSITTRQKQISIWLCCCHCSYAIRCDGICARVFISRKYSMYVIPIKFARIRYYCIIYTMYSIPPYLPANFCYSFLISFIWMNCVTEYFPAFLALHWLKRAPHFKMLGGVVDGYEAIGRDNSDGGGNTAEKIKKGDKELNKRWLTRNVRWALLCDRFTTSL